MVEQWTENPCVPSSSLGLGTFGNSDFHVGLARHCGGPGKGFSGPDSAVDGGSSNGRTTVFGTVNRGSNPCPPAFFGAGHRRLGLNAVGKWIVSWINEYGAYSSKAERLIVDQKVAGSSPARRPSVRLCLRSSWRDSGIKPTLFLLLGNEETTI